MCVGGHTWLANAAIPSAICDFVGAGNAANWLELDFERACRVALTVRATVDRVGVLRREKLDAAGLEPELVRSFAVDLRRSRWT